MCSNYQENERDGKILLTLGFFCVPNIMLFYANEYDNLNHNSGPFLFHGINIFIIIYIYIFKKA